ncbi:2'-5' RNA ligase family protein [Clostridium sp. D53t1_180928_C8]|uniref:2'-5' RNA ligase family protein n=1 Tax=Clostridium sp. D53t1_180928_C8 TaxID=2787101 RepID=UPI0018AB34FA|nr:2'-5' RNA ligase family protein [Clostridium sp. D53t1_180928_C8]
MKLENLYESIMNKGITAIENNKEYVDSLIEDKTDTRMGITLAIRPSENLKKEIMNIERKIREVENNQYYYPENDYHITLLDIITARQGFIYTTEQVENCKKITINAVKDLKQFEIKLKGVIASDGAIMVKGFYEVEMELLRQRLRQSILDNNMNLDERYPTISSHITIARFKNKIQERKGLIEILKEYENYDFGTLKVSEIELIYHNWYDSKKEVLEKYIIK